MKIFPIEDLKPGFEVAQSILDENGRVLLYRGVLLTEQYIQALRDKGYSQLYVKDEDDAGIEADEDLSPVVRSLAIQTLRQAYLSIETELEALKGASVEDFQRVCGSEAMRTLMGAKGPLAKIHDVISHILDEVLTRSTLAGLTTIRNQDTQLFGHSLDVCVVSVMVGQCAGVSTSHMRQLATGSLLHDIGMLFVAKGLPEEVRVRQHTTLGYELLRASDDPDIMAPHVAYEHHEHQDGTGLPRGLKSSNTLKRVRTGGPVPTLIGEICAVANVYDHLISGSGGTPKLYPDEALAEIAQMAGTVLNRDVVAMFRRVVPVYPRGMQVFCKGGPFDGYLAVVSKVKQSDLAHPTVVLVRDRLRRRITPEEQDTAAYPEMELRAAGV